MVWKRFVIVLLTAAMLPASCRKTAPVRSSPSPRIVSFSPALTELLFDMRLGDHVVGVTRWCPLPAGQERTVVGDETRPDTEAILGVRPDLVLTQSDPEKFREIRRQNPKIRIQKVNLERIEDILAIMRQIGQWVGDAPRGEQAAAELSRQLEAVRRRVAHRPRPRVVFVMGYDRPTVAGAGTFLDEMIQTAGGVNAGADVPGMKRYRETNVEGILNVRPDVLVCQLWEGGRAEAARAYWSGLKDLPAARTGRIFIVTDRHWTIPSARVGKLTAELAKMIHPDLSGEGEKR